MTDSAPLTSDARARLRECRRPVKRVAGIRTEACWQLPRPQSATQIHPQKVVTVLEVAGGELLVAVAGAATQVDETEATAAVMSPEVSGTARSYRFPRSWENASTAANCPMPVAVTPALTSGPLLAPCTSGPSPATETKTVVAAGRQAMTLAQLWMRIVLQMLQSAQLWTRIRLLRTRPTRRRLRDRPGCAQLRICRATARLTSARVQLCCGTYRTLSFRTYPPFLFPMPLGEFSGRNSWICSVIMCMQ